MDILTHLKVKLLLSPRHSRGITYWISLLSGQRDRKAQDNQYWCGFTSGFVWCRFEIG